jgi:hypothetical protein
VVAVLSGQAKSVVAGVVGAGWLACALTGVVGAARGRFVRLRGAWDVAGAAAMLRSGSR